MDTAQDLAPFLLARIAEVEQLAHAASAGPWIALTIYPDRAEVAQDRRATARLEDSSDWTLLRTREDADAIHIARHDPARVLADCEAKRRIVALHNPCDDWSYGDASTCPELCALALPYADHPDFRQEWKP